MSDNHTVKKSKKIEDMVDMKPQPLEISPFDMWYLKKYKKHHIDTFTSNNKELVTILKNKKETDWKYSGINKYHSILSLAYRVLPDTTNTITVLYKIKDIHNTDREVSYCIAYLEHRIKKSNILYMDLLEKKYNMKLGMSDHIFINNICPSGSMISKDGEYRSVILNWNSVQVFFEKNKNIEKIFNFIKDYFKDVLRERKYILLTEHYFPTDRYKNEFHYETELLSTTNKIKFFCIVWFNFYYTYYLDMISNHINDIFKKLMFKYKREDISFFKLIWKTFPSEDIEMFRYVCSNYIMGYNIENIKIHNKTKLGQKIIPLNLLDAQNFFNIHYDAWKEYLINMKVSDLVINHISNGFCLSSNWFIIKNSDKTFYDNPSQADRIEKSQIALKIADILSQAKIYTYQNINEMKEDEKQKIMDLIIYTISNDKKGITSWLSNEFKILYTKIQDAINHTKQNIIMSNVSLCLMSEFVGKTFYDSVSFTKQSSYYKSLVSNIFSQDNYANFRKYMFQLCYSLYCIHDKLKIIHGDLHLNNITLNPLFYKKKIQMEEKETNILYSLDDDHQYIFKNNFYNLCLIDFSRSIIHPEHAELFKLEHIPYDVIHNKNAFLVKQVKELLAYLYSTKPEYKEFGASIETSIIHHFDAYFKILSILDLYNLTNKLIEFMKSPNISKPHKDSMKLISDLFKSSEYYLSIVLTKLIHHRNFVEVNRMEYPIFSIIKDIFDEDGAHRKSPQDFDNIVDVYKYKNTVDASLSSFKHFPTEIKEMEIKHLIDIKSLIERRKLYEEKMLQNYQVVNVIQTRQLQKNI